MAERVGWVRVLPVVAFLAAAGSLVACSNGDGGSQEDATTAATSAVDDPNSTYWVGFSEGMTAGVRTGSADGREAGAPEGERRGHDSGFDDGLYDLRNGNRYEFSYYPSQVSHLAPPFLCPTGTGGSIPSVPTSDDQAWSDGYRKGFESTYGTAYESECDRQFEESFLDRYRIGYDEGFGRLAS